MTRPALLSRFDPKLLTMLKGYTPALLAADLGAGLTVAMVALPLSLAIAIASGAEPGTGLVTAIVAGFIISALGGSRVQIGGPTGAFIVVVYSVIATHGFDGLLTATLMAGVILVVAGFANAGALLRFVPEPVIHGFTTGIAIIIAASQLKDLFGLSIATVPAELIAKLEALWAARATFNMSALMLALAAIVLIVALKRAFPRLPGLLLAVVLASAAVPLMGLEVDTIASRFGAIPAALPMPSLPEISVVRLVELLPSALVIAFLAGIESLLSAVVSDRMAGGKHRPNTEIIAQGLANCASACVGGLPATGAIARTA
ncbi:MAG: SulP family inorganic anion transporter, partial [Phyllobacteriaceae bacterium]|nr:SulP family inorganic anion transporter [Phyllobacteriaceae bacterium]